MKFSPTVSLFRAPREEAGRGDGTISVPSPAACVFSAARIF